MTDPEILTALLPSTWLAWLHEWGPTILAALVVTTTLVHLLLPAARRFETWAIASQVTWDDGPARALVRGLELTASATRWLLAYLPRVSVGEPAPRSSSRRRPPPMTVLALVAVASLAVVGCSSGPQIPIQGQPITIQVEAEACGLHGPRGTTGGEALPEQPEGGPRAVGTCSVVVWVDSPVSGTTQDTRGVETGEVEVSPETEVDVGAL